MKTCFNCGNQIPEGYQFCPHCGTAAQAPDYIAEEQQFLDDTHRFLRYERIPWKIYGIVFTILGGVFAFLGLLLTIAMVAAADAFLGGLMGGVYFFCGALFVAVGIVNFKLVPKIDFYLERVYTDPKTVFARTESIGMIVFCAFFNEIALIFYIINFVRMKTNKNVVERIKQRF